MTRRYVLSRSADSDLESILRYTRLQWGLEQASQYSTSIERGIERLAAGGPAVRNLDRVYVGLRSLRCERHFIFGLLRSDAPLLVVAILHERMDLLTRVASRLQ
ncbi:type II toxin-antitoxin system RelE/ParE family toxin [Novosphingobium sp.]|uniref:type II toxin-antitoxin system RelE/ParE family toxin n=1 Tax=Novosphingobium sp. TaxID=1874826 RepID=UPI003BAD3CC6